MATALLNAKNILGTCCGGAENLFGKIFHKDDEDEQQAAPAAASAPATGAKPVGAKKFGFTDKQAHYEDVKWGKLSLGVRKAAKAIGFEQKTWDDGEWLPIDDKHWHDLTSEEKTACETLGWDQHAWDEKYENVAWADMPKHVQKGENVTCSCGL